MARPTAFAKDHDDVVVHCPSGAYPFVAEVPLSLRRGPVVRYPCEKCQYAVWRFGMDRKFRGEPIAQKAVLVQHRVDSVTGEVIGSVVTAFWDKLDNRPGKGGVPVEEDPVALIHRSVAAWNKVSAGGQSTPTSSNEEQDRGPE